jgi:hypothetical protein
MHTAANAWAFAKSRLATVVTTTRCDPATPAMKARAIFAAPRTPIRSGFDGMGYMADLSRLDVMHQPLP